MEHYNYILIQEIDTCGCCGLIIQVLGVFNTEEELREAVKEYRSNKAYYQELEMYRGNINKLWDFNSGQFPLSEGERI